MWSCCWRGSIGDEDVSLAGADRDDDEGCVGKDEVKDLTLLLVDTEEGEGDVGVQAVMPPIPPPAPVPVPPPPAPPPPPPPPPALVELLGAPDMTLKLL